MFKASLLNPLRLIDTFNIDNSFDGNFAIDQLLTYQDPKCYFQKWQKTDSLKLQILSDYVPTDLLIKEIATNKTILSVSWQAQPTQIIGHTFSVYELSTALNFAEGKYYAEFSYEENGDIHRLISEPFEVQTIHDNTLLLKYKNSENDKDIIFDTGIEFQFRLEAAVKYDAPGNNRNVFNDQTVNPTLLSATPFRKFKLFVGFKYGVPFWIQDKVNIIITVDQVSYDNVFYQTPAGAEWESEKNDFNAFIGSSIELYPTNNNFAKYETTTVNEDNEFTPMQKIIPYSGISANFGIAGKFKYRSLLEHVCVLKRSAGSFVLKIGTSNGGAEVAQFTVNDFENTFTIEHLFSGTATVYFTGITGADIDLDVIYKQLDEKPIPLLPSDGGASVSEGKGSVKVYHEFTDGDMDIHWNTGTGLGQPNTAFDGWAWMDGRNGTPDWRKRVPLMFDRDDENWNLSKIGGFIGASKIKLTKGQLPAVGVNLFTDFVNGAGGGGNTPGIEDTVARARNAGNEALNYEIVKGNGTPNRGKSANLGTGDDIDITPNGIISLWIIKIKD